MIVKRHYFLKSVGMQFRTKCVWISIHYACMWWVIKHIFAQWLCEYAYNLNNLRNIFRPDFVFSSGIISNLFLRMLESSHGLEEMKKHIYLFIYWFCTNKSKNITTVSFLNWWVLNMDNTFLKNLKQIKVKSYYNCFFPELMGFKHG